VLVELGSQIYQGLRVLSLNEPLLHRSGNQIGLESLFPELGLVENFANMVVIGLLQDLTLVHELCDLSLVLFDVLEEVELGVSFADLTLSTKHSVQMRCVQTVHFASILANRGLVAFLKAWWEPRLTAGLLKLGQTDPMLGLVLLHLHFLPFARRRLVDCLSVLTEDHSLSLSLGLTNDLDCVTCQQLVLLYTEVS
jgi:hypothetical protein